MAEKVASKNNRVILLVVAVVILIIINGIQFYLHKERESKIKEQLDNKEIELVSTFVKLDSISRQLDLKIEQLEELGESVDSLVSIKEQLEKEKYELRVSKNIAQERYNKIKNKVEAYEVLLKRKDEEIAQLKEVNEALLEETIELKHEKNELKDELNSMERI